MSIAAFLSELRTRGIELELTDGKLTARAPKGALTPQLSAALKERKEAITAFLREGLVEKRDVGGLPPIVPVPRREYMPVSFSQERLWYLSQVDENPAVYNLPLSFRLVGPLRLDLLQRALDVLEERHEALRITVEPVDGVAMQKIHRPRGMPLSHLDLRAGQLPPDAAPVETVLQREAMAPFDLARGPLVRATLVRTGEEEHYLLIVTHHIISDGLSTQIILRELVALYEALEQGTDAKLEPLPVQFVDYAVWQRGWLQGAALDEQLSFWTDRLSGELPPLDVATDFPRPAIRTANGSKEPLRLPKEVVRRLAAIAREEGATTYMVLLALFKTLIHRHSGQEDLIVGSPVANRTRQESTGMVGFVANTLVLRTRADGEPTFRELVRRVRDVCVGAFRHQDTPFQKLVEVLNPPRDLSRTPVFQAFFTFHEVTSQATRMGPLELHPFVTGSNVSRMDLSLFLRELDTEILGSLEYNTDIFARDTVLGMIGHLGELAKSAAANPDSRIGDLAMLTEAERITFLAWNATARPCPDDLLHQLFEARAAAAPERVAVQAGSECLSYGELDARANRLADRLRAAGVRADELVGVCLERTVDLPVALLAVLKAGAAYLPLDPDFPQNRLTLMLEDSQARVIVSQRSLSERLPRTGAAVLAVDAPDADPLEAPGRAASAATSESRAYVLYTSGSTGRPKGVEVRHRNIVSFLAAMQERPGIGPDDVLVAVTTLSFDIAALEIFLPLAVGARVVLAARDVATDATRLGELILTSGATVMQATPATWRMLFDGGWAGAAGLKVLCGGEALPPSLAGELRSAVGEVWNMYGPTETTVWSTCARIVDASEPISIGLPIANTVFRVVDRRGHQVPVRVPGELLIGGAGVALGYLGRPDLTAERFVSDPTGIEPGAIFYRTGDLARMGPDGRLECMGRLDDQVKIQGFRVELGEVESVLGTLPEVAEAVVSVHSQTGGDARLVAHVVYRPGKQLTMSEVRRHLREHLPVYMVPGLVVDTPALPRTPNGKVDRRALPNPLASPALRTYVPPVSEAEQIVAEAWRTLLSVDQVGRHDNFFELGGHSLLSMRAVATIEQRTGKRIDPRLMFFQTVAQIAALLEPQPAVAQA